MPVIGIAGEFPLNDDWAYTRIVHEWLASGRFVRPEWAWAPSFANVAWGALFARLFGLSFESLRASGVVAGGLGVLAAVWLAREMGATPRRAALVGALLAANPVYLLLSYSFMTDVPFTLFTLAGLAAAVRALRDRAPLAAGLAVLCIAAGLLSRNAGPALPLAVAIAVLASRIRSARAAWIALGVGVPVLAVGAWWLVSQQDLPNLIGRLGWFLAERVLSPEARGRTLRAVVGAAPLLGLFLAPAILTSWPGGRAGVRLGALAALGAAGLLLLGQRFGMHPPFSVNLVYDLGLGARTLHGRDALPSAPLAWWLATALGAGLISAAGLRALGGAPAAIRAGIAPAHRLLPLTFVAVYLGTLAFQQPFFDRWLLPALAPLAAGLLCASRDGGAAARAAGSRLRAALAGVALAALGAYALAGSHDAMVHHRLRWALLDGRLAAGVAAEDIDGGFEFAGWERGEQAAAGQVSTVRGAPTAEWLVSYAASVPGYAPVETLRAPRWLPPGEQTVTLHRRLAGGPP